MKKKLALAMAIVFLIAAIVGYSFYVRSISPMCLNRSILIPTGTDFEGLIKIIEPHVNNVNSFIWVAEKKNYPNKIRAGKFRIMKE